MAPLSVNLNHPYAASVTRVQKNWGDAPVVQLVDQLLQDALKHNASDIHFEPDEQQYRVRIRVDGVLHKLVELPPDFASMVTARLKVMAHLDIAERRLPQDGRFYYALPSAERSRRVDCRVNVCPVLFGEKVVLRFLSPQTTVYALETLGYSKIQAQALRNALTQPQGMILMVGPTGSGKSTSLYTALRLLNDGSRNISTVEDPVEQVLSGINQVPIHPKIGRDFSVVLRAFLRQDPDVMMIGEIRDLETAEIAVKAAQTGHLVLSTLHTNSVVDTMLRLEQMGIPHYHLSGALQLIVAQRLLRCLCPQCKKPDTVSSDTLKHLGFEGVLAKEQLVYRAVGCDQCCEGYCGRTGVYEVVPISDALRQCVAEQQGRLQLTQQLVQEGYVSIRQSALEKILSGRVSVAEVNRVI